MTLPKKMTVRGYAINSGGPANGIWLEHDGIAALTQQKPAHFVRNHELDIKAIAGSVAFPRAERFDIEVPTFTKDPKSGVVKEGEPRKEKATLLAFEADLVEGNLAYGDVASSITALRAAGKVPNVSVYIYGSDIGFEEDTGRYFLMAPYWVRHLGHVDVGAFSDDVGVGVYDVEMSLGGKAKLTFAPDAMAPVDQALGLATAPLEMECGVTVCFANMGDLVAKFIAEHGPDSPLVEKLGKLLGLDEEDEPDEASIASPDSKERSEASQAAYTNPRLLNVVDSSESTRESNMPDNAPLQSAGAPPAANAAPAGAPAGTQPASKPMEAAAGAPPVDIEALLKRHEEAIMARVRKEQTEAALAERRKALSTAHGLDPAILAGMTEAQLEHLENKFLEVKATANPLKRGARSAGAAPAKRPWEEWAEDKSEAEAWLNEQRKKTLGQHAFDFAGPARATGHTEVDA